MSPNPISRDTYIERLEDHYPLDKMQNLELKGAKESVIKHMSKDSLSLKADRVIAATDFQELAAICAQRRSGQGGTKSLKALAEYLSTNRPKGLTNKDGNPINFGDAKITQRGLRHLAAYGEYQRAPDKAEHRRLEQVYAEGGSAKRADYEDMKIHNAGDSGTLDINNKLNYTVQNKDVQYHHVQAAPLDIQLLPPSSGNIQNIHVSGDDNDVMPLNINSSEKFENYSKIQKLDTEPVPTTDGGLQGHIKFPPAGAELELKQDLGKGASGAVYLAEDPLTGSKYAIKAMSCKDLYALPEVNNTKSLTHDNIAKYCNCALSKDGKTLYMQMEYIDGKMMSDNIEKIAGDKPKFINLGMQLVQGMSHKTAKGYYVKDLKPANVMINTAQNELKLIDHGADQNKDDVGENESLQGIGTPKYYVPEVLARTIKPDVDKFNAYATCLNLALMRLGIKDFQFRKEIFKAETGIEYDLSNKDHNNLYFNLSSNPEKSITALRNKMNAIPHQDRLPVDEVILKGLDTNPVNRPSMTEIEQAFAKARGNA